MPPSRPSGWRPDPAACAPSRPNLAALCDEARRLALRRCRAEAAAGRLRGLPHADGRVARLGACSDRLLVSFHRALDRIWAADGFDEALAVFRDYRAELARSRGRAQGPPPQGPALIPIEVAASTCP